MTFWGAELQHPWYLLAGLAVIPAVWLAHRAAGRVVFSSIDALPAEATWRTARRRIAPIPRTASTMRAISTGPPAMNSGR